MLAEASLALHKDIAEQIKAIYGDLIADYIWWMPFTEDEITTLMWVGTRYGWSSSTLDVMTYNEDGSGDIALSSQNISNICEGIESDMEGGHDAFPLLDYRTGINLADKLMMIYNLSL